MRYVFAPPPRQRRYSPYKQGESAVRVNIPHGSCTLYSVICTLKSLFCNNIRRMLFYYLVQVITDDEEDDEGGDEESTQDGECGG